MEAVGLDGRRFLCIDQGVGTIHGRDLEGKICGALGMDPKHATRQLARDALAKKIPRVTEPNLHILCQMVKPCCARDLPLRLPPVMASRASLMAKTWSLGSEYVCSSCKAKAR